jgi:hypothetical protein
MPDERSQVTQTLLSARKTKKFRAKEHSTEELVDMLTAIAEELKRRSNIPTEKMGYTQQSTDFPSLNAPINEYITTPDEPQGEGVDPWYLVLLSPDPHAEVLPLKITGDTVIGRNIEGESQVDVNLTQFIGRTAGVSRYHAMLRPTSDGVLLTDLGSTNGTYANNQRVTLGKPLRLSPGDTIRFAGLSFKVYSVSRQP